MDVFLSSADGALLVVCEPMEQGSEYEDCVWKDAFWEDDRGIGMLDTVSYAVGEAYMVVLLGGWEDEIIGCGCHGGDMWVGMECSAPALCYTLLGETCNGEAGCAWCVRGRPW